MTRSKYFTRTTACLAIAATAVIATGCNNKFKKADTNKNGKLETTELDTALAKGLHKAGDKNHDGNVTFAEWKAVNESSNQAKFNKYDTDGTTGLSLTEATTALNNEGTFKKLSDKIDTNDDGVIDKAEAGTFHDAMVAADGRNEVEKLNNLLK